MKKSQLQYNLEEKYIATEPVVPQHNSKLMIIDRDTKKISHKHFHELPSILNKNDVLVFNQTKVIKSNIIGHKETGGKVDLLLTKNLSNNPTVYEVLGKNIPNKNKKIFFEDDLFATVIKKSKDQIKIRFNKNLSQIDKYLETYGKMPIPPYIRKKRLNQSDSKAIDDNKLYQTSFAKNLGSIAAPTAGLHFTDKLLSDLKKSGVQTAFVTLHVGLGTFQPINDEDLENHQMHSEFVTLSPDVAQFLNNQKEKGKRIIAVGTTSVRVLESCSDDKGILHPAKKDTDIFIYPPYKFKFVDGIITNFHLPGSTLLALVSAFVSNPNTKDDFGDFKSSIVGEAYEKAKRENYRFYSYGDGMLIT